MNPQLFRQRHDVLATLQSLDRHSTELNRIPFPSSLFHLQFLPCKVSLIRMSQVKGSVHRTGHIGYTFSPALPVQQDEKIVEIDFLPVNAQRLISSTARVSEESDQGRKPMPSQFLRLPTEEEFQLSCRIRRQDDLRLFHLRNFERRARPLQVGVN